MSFLVTSHGRSGTHWLTRELNKSPTWEVYHERWTNALFTSPNQAQKMQQGVSEGDVDSRLRRVALELLNKGRVDMVAVILRNPIKIMESAYGRSPLSKFEFILANLDEDLRAIQALHEDPRVISLQFDAMIGGTGQIPFIGSLLGINNLRKEDVDMQTTGSTSKPMPTEQYRQVLEVSRWFMEKHRDLEA